MAEQIPARPLQASLKVAAPPDVVWRVIADLRRTGEWSPECTHVWPLGKVRRGSWLVGENRRGRVRWVTLSRIVRFQSEQELAWHVLTNGSRWTYRLESVPGGTQITQTRETPHGVSSFARWFTERFLGGQDGHDDDLEVGMASGLQRINALVSS